MSDFLQMLKVTFLENIYLLFVFGILYYIAVIITKRNSNSKSKKNSGTSVVSAEKQVSTEMLNKKEFLNKDNSFLVGDSLEKTPKEFEDEIEDIVHQVDEGKQIRVPLVKAMYILKRYDKHNVFASEDGKIIMDKLKKIYDENGKEISTKIDLVEKNKKDSSKLASKKEKENIKTDSEGNFIVYNPNGYTKISKEGRIVASINYAKEEAKKKKEESGNRNNDSKLQEKLTETEEVVYAMQKQLLENEKNKTQNENTAEDNQEAESVKESSEVTVEAKAIEDSKEKSTEDQSTEEQLVPGKSEIESLLDKHKSLDDISPIAKKNSVEKDIVDDEIEKTNDDKPVVNYFNADRFGLPVLFEKDITLEYVISCIENMKQEYLEKLFSLFVKEEVVNDGKIIYVGIDLDRGTYLINTNLFLFALSHFFKDSENFMKLFCGEDYNILTNACNMHLNRFKCTIRHFSVNLIL